MAGYIINPSSLVEHAYARFDSFASSSRLFTEKENTGSHGDDAIFFTRDSVMSGYFSSLSIGMLVNDVWVSYDGIYSLSILYKAWSRQ